MIKAIYAAAKKGAPQLVLDEAYVYAGKGIVGDRHFDKRQCAGQNLTLIEAEEITRFNEHFNQSLQWHETRRNIVVEKIRLNDLVGKIFTIGDVALRGIELCEPCTKLARRLQSPQLSRAEVINGFLHRSGLRCDVLSNGRLALGMAVQTCV